MVHMCFAVVNQEWRGIPTRLNNIPHSREIREYFYNDVLKATKLAIEDKKTRLQVASYLFHLC
jgi:adenylate kinase